MQLSQAFPMEDLGRKIEPSKTVLSSLISISLLCDPVSIYFNMILEPGFLQTFFFVSFSIPATSL